MADDDIKIPDSARAKLPSITDTLEDAAFRMADEMIATGLPNEEACSVVACMFIKAAWVVAATGRISDGADPRPEKFRDAVDHVLSVVKFRSVAEMQAQGAAHD